MVLRETLWDWVNLTVYAMAVFCLLLMTFGAIVTLIILWIEPVESYENSLLYFDISSTAG